jgi:hypothetical protein
LLLRERRALCKEARPPSPTRSPDKQIARFSHLAAHRLVNEVDAARVLGAQHRFHVLAAVLFFFVDRLIG